MACKSAGMSTAIALLRQGDQGSTSGWKIRGAGTVCWSHYWHQHQGAVTTSCDTAAPSAKLPCDRSLPSALPQRE